MGYFGAQHLATDRGLLDREEPLKTFAIPHAFCDFLAVVVAHIACGAYTSSRNQVWGEVQSSSLEKPQKKINEKGHHRTVERLKMREVEPGVCGVRVDRTGGRTDKNIISASKTPVFH